MRTPWREVVANMVPLDPYLGTSRRVLVIDDSPLCRRVVRSILAPDQVELFEAATGMQGFALAQTLVPSLVLLDLMLPGWDGFETLRHFKEDPRTREIPIIFLSARATSAEKAKGLDLGAVDFLSKPFEAIELRARMRAALRMRDLQDLLEQRAHYDGLTGLGNRVALEERLATSWEQCRRRAAPLAVLIADLDHFKRINDRHGHGAGDEILRRTAAILRDVARSGDFVARYGGEEFVVVTPDCDLDGGVALAERFRQRLSWTSSVSHDPGANVTTSVGVAASNDLACLTPDGLLWRADQALYQAKAAGRDAVWSWDPALEGPAPSRFAASGPLSSRSH
jgi:diguanylate cyclase (GGDEF)-like protein